MEKSLDQEITSEIFAGLEPGDLVSYTHESGSSWLGIVSFTESYAEKFSVVHLTWVTPRMSGATYTNKDMISPKWRLMIKAGDQAQ